MMQKSIDFKNIFNENNAFVDTSSLIEFSNIQNTLNCPLNDTIVRELKRTLNGNDEYGLRKIIPFVERWIVHDKFIYDEIALQCLEPEKRNKIVNLSKQFPLFSTQIPNDIYRHSETIIMHTSHWLAKVDNKTEWNRFGFGVEKNYQDMRSKEAYSSISRSDLGVERTIFYYEVGAMCRLPIIFHPNRNLEIKAINSAMIDAYNIIKRELEDKFEKPIANKFLSEGLDINFNIPALFNYVLTISGNKNQSILQTMSDLKYSSEAIAFRKWLLEIQYYLSSESMNHQMEGLKMVTELEKISTQWIESLDTKNGVLYQKRKLNLSKIPRIGSLFGLFDTFDTIEISDYILNKKEYLIFLSNWYD